MTAIAAWELISAKISSSSALAASRLVTAENAYNAGGALYEHNVSTLEAIVGFRRQWGAALSSETRDLLDQFIAKHSNLVKDNSTIKELLIERIQKVAVVFQLLDGEIRALLGGDQQNLRLVSERAFIHLQRSIEVDEVLRERWKRAYADHETACERLGSVHLLSHGVWAFKLNAERARTDLMFEEPLDFAKTGRAAAGLVHTEWKLCRRGDGANEFAEAVAQCRLYRSGALAALELRDYHYAVVVSRDNLIVPPDIVEGNVRFRHVNIALEPSTPSVLAKRRA